MKYLVTLILLLTILDADIYKVNTKHSHIIFKVRHLLFSSVKGRFDKFEGSYEIVNRNLKNLAGSVVVASCSTKNTKRDKYLLSEKFFNVKKFPYMKMQLLYVQNHEAVVSLQIKDITRQARFKLNLDHDKVTLHGKISRKDFALTWSRAIEAGGLVVAEHINIEIVLLPVAQN